MLVVPLRNDHDRGSFDCGDEALNLWFKQFARQHNSKFYSRTYVAVESEDSPEVLGYFALSVSEIDRSVFDHDQLSGHPKRIPAFRLARLASSISHRGRRVGLFCADDAIRRTKEAAQAAGGALLVVDAKPSAVDFYKKLGFEQFEHYQDKFFYSLHKR